MSEEVYKCVVSGKEIPQERVEALIMLNIPQSRWTCVEHALPIPRKGIYLGEVGTSELLIVDKVYDDSVRSVFRGGKNQIAAKETSEEPQEKEEYDSKEMNYYISDEEQVDPEEKIEIIKRHEP
jgi:hypothetical protein